MDDQLFEELRNEIEKLPVVDCHEHMVGPSGRPPYREPIAALIHGYVFSDLISASYGVPDQEVMKLQDPDVSTDEKWPLFDQLWSSIEHTAYARVTKYVLSEVYGVEALTRRSLDRVAERLDDQTEERYFERIDKAGIQAVLVDVLGWIEGGLGSFLDGTKTFPDKWRPLISLPPFHPTVFRRSTVDTFGGLVDRHVSSLEDYLETVHEIMELCVDRGAIGMKDQSAYERDLAYEHASRAEAEKQFNAVLSDVNTALGWPESRPLNDYLFHRFMDFAADLGVPVQLHTGHLAGSRDSIGKTNASLLTRLVEVHRNVRFDLFHGNWPYLGELLFLGKNHPQVALDCCWLHIIDPVYAVDLLERATLTLPHTKLHGFGGDYFDVPEFAVGHLAIARDNIARALCRMIEHHWLDEGQALELARAWLFENPNRFFGLDLET